MPDTTQVGLSENAASALAYVTLIPAIVFLAMPPYNQSPTVRFHSWQSIFFSIGAFVLCMVLTVIAAIPLLNLIDLILFPLVGIGLLILWIVMLVQALNGKRFSIPFIGPLAAKQAGV